MSKKVLFIVISLIVVAVVSSFFINHSRQTTYGEVLSNLDLGTVHSMEIMWTEWENKSNFVEESVVTSDNFVIDKFTKGLSNEVLIKSNKTSAEDYMVILSTEKSKFVLMRIYENHINIAGVTYKTKNGNEFKKLIEEIYISNSNKSN